MGGQFSMERNRNTLKIASGIFVIIIVFLILCHIRTAILISSEYNRLNYQNNEFVLQTSTDSFYEASINGHFSGVYTQEEIKRIKSFNAIYDEIAEYEYAYFNDSYLIPLLFKDRIYRSNVFGNIVYFNLSTNHSIYLKEDFQLPEVTVNNISKIIISGEGLLNDTYQFTTEEEKRDFFINCYTYFQQYDKEFLYYDIYLFYENSDSIVYEHMEKDDFLKYAILD